ncbi:hypothetical protein L3Y19_gp003 [Gordonia phage Neville]|uniref:Uncharacterized protein n=2 Tax=Nevillevirus TaxID=3044773 RepID=A0A515MGV3_9CAUD|nr:hypothetical protein L3Y19_gp003 [Gordonia phage Neville]YP_010245988.1 hypothetical protein L3Y20_gp003 [Gordonia phage Trax]AXQ64490.1 hypothetical protein SEA_NEVILLE_3 [Gordonia phage Neville]QDM55890.1 hypothetical protein SEA_TRAX_3 [Gordonia phage Trax]
MKTLHPTEENIQDLHSVLERLDDCEHGDSPLVEFLRHVLHVLQTGESVTVCATSSTERIPNPLP